MASLIKDLSNPPTDWRAPEFAYAISKAEKENKEMQDKELTTMIEQAKKQYIEKYGKDSFYLYSDPRAIELYDFLALKPSDHSKDVKSSSSSSNSASIASSVASKTLNERKSS